MDKITTKFTAFYSWQSDLPDESNRQLIRQCLRNAASAIEGSFPGLVIDTDEATRNMPGSPNIPATILAKIRTADAFICDVTIINSTSDNSRKVPNPNVIFELGYAVAVLGWERIVLLFNSDFGTLEDLPFDFDRHRASSFSASGTPTTKTKKHLTNLLKTAINAIVLHNPMRPIQEQSDEQRKHSRDVESVKWILSSIHLPTLDEFISTSPHYLNNNALKIYDDFANIINSSLFYLYDSDLMKSLEAFGDAFYETTRYYKFYYPDSVGGRYIFSNHLDQSLIDESQEALNSITDAKGQMREALDKILDQVRERFLEVDIHRAYRES